MKNNIRAFILITASIIASCSSGDDGGGEVANPEAATLVFPLKDAECNEGEIISDTESKVPFEWNAAANVDRYVISLRNLATETTAVFSTENTTIDITILRGTPYSWKVISRANGTTETAQSESWNFYNAGPGVENYAPFPAELIAPQMGLTFSSPTTTLEWEGSDADGDISEYEVYVDTSSPPTALVASQTSTTFNVSLEANTVYYWQIVTKDQHGNSTKSPVFEFKTL